MVASGKPDGGTEGAGLVCASSCRLQEAPPPAQRLAGPLSLSLADSGTRAHGHHHLCHSRLEMSANIFFSAASALASDDWPGDGGLTPVSRGLLSIRPGIFSPSDGLCMSDTSLAFEMIPPDVFQSIMASVTAVVLGNGPVSVLCLWCAVQALDAGTVLEDSGNRQSPEVRE